MATAGKFFREATVVGLRATDCERRTDVICNGNPASGRGLTSEREVLRSHATVDSSNCPSRPELNLINWRDERRQRVRSWLMVRPYVMRIAISAVLLSAAIPASAGAVNYEDIYQPWDSSTSGETKAPHKRHSRAPVSAYGDYKPVVTSDPNLKISVSALAAKGKHHRHRSAAAGSQRGSGAAIAEVAPAALVGGSGSGSGWTGIAFVVLGLVGACFVLRPRRHQA